MGRGWIFACLLYLSKLNNPVIKPHFPRSTDMPNSGPSDARRLRFERLVAPWRDDLFRYTFWLCRDPDLAEDVVQEAMLRAFRSLDSLNEEASVKAWLLTITRREHARVYERKRLETQDIDELSAAEAALIATGNDTDVDDMREAIFELEEGYREPLALQVIFGLTTEEIAVMMDIKQGAVLTRLHRARKKLIEQVRPGLAVIAES
ncbi:MAG: sigma-70 family RNA polymerase sigma factor [Gammaproteobacteria bacterium]